MARTFYHQMKRRIDAIRQQSADLKGMSDYLAGKDTPEARAIFFEF